uniref:Ig-like domain-containing protein n=1 Tax=Myripristis murdjan TaxID=586833 RepID=A0A667ZV66_9TELE
MLQNSLMTLNVSFKSSPPAGCPASVDAPVDVSGDDVTLICQAPDDVDIAAVEWSRTDLKELEPVFLSVDGHIVPDHQHPSFKNRVELKDKEMKNGDLSVTLKNVTEYDSGTYECRIKAAGEGRRTRAIIKTKPISTIQLEVVDQDPGELNGCRLNLSSLTGFYRW